MTTSTTPASLAIPDKLASINATKQAIRQAIVNKGVEVPTGTTFYDYAGKIGEIESGGFVGTATITFVTPYSYTAREIQYINENYEFVTSTDESVQIPVPQIVYIEFGGERDSYHMSEGDRVAIYQSLITGVYQIYGDTTFTASR